MKLGCATAPAIEDGVFDRERTVLALLVISISLLPCLLNVALAMLFLQFPLLFLMGKAGVWPSLLGTGDSSSSAEPGG